MKLGSCPKCGSRKVRTGKIYLLHLARLALGSRRRYCRNCRSRWIGSEAVFLPSARLAAILFICVASALALDYLKKDGWFESQAGSFQTDGRDARAAATGVESLAGEVLTMLGGDASGAWQASSGRGAAGSGAPIRWREGQLMSEYSTYLQGGHDAGPQSGQSQEMQNLIRQLAAMGKTPRQVASEVDSTDKRTLWNKYGSHFANEADAKAAYDDFQRHRNEIPK